MGAKMSASVNNAALKNELWKRTFINLGANIRQNCRKDKKSGLFFWEGTQFVLSLPLKRPKMYLL